MVDINENIVYTTNLLFEYSKEKIIDKALKLHSKDNIKEAVKYYEFSIKEGFDDYRIYSNYARILWGFGKLKEAEILQRKAVKLKPDLAKLHCNLGNILRDLGKLKEAELSQRNAIKIEPSSPYAFCNLGSILIDLGKSKEAEIPTRRAIEIKPDFYEAYYNLGIILIDLGKSKEAEKSLRQAIKFKSDFALAYNNLGGLLRNLGNFQEAEKLLKKAISIKPDLAIAHNNLAALLRDSGKFNQAIKRYEKSLKIDSNLSSSKWGLIKSKGAICDWSNQEIINRWLQTLGLNGSSVISLDLFPYEDNPFRQLQRAKNLYKEKYIKSAQKFEKYKNKKIHIGYFSADFRSHPMMFLMGSMFKLHDKSKFEIFLYSFVDKEDEYTQIAKESGCIYRDIKDLNDIETVQLARSDQLDIAIDRMGYVRGHRINIFSYRVAPIQIHYMAYCGTLGNDNIDYLIGDNIIIPNGYEKYYSEKIIRLPNCYQCNDNKKEICKDPISRKDFNLPDEGFIFTCFCSNKKITPKEFDIWMKLLKEIKGSVLWLYKSNQYSFKNLMVEAKNRNVDPNRLIFADKLPLNKHLARYSLGDLALDTFNYNGHTTTSDALWAGLPVLTKIGESFSARVSASILSALDLSELITFNEKEYLDKALNLARNPKEILRLKDKLAKSKETSTLYNSELFTRNLEEKFVELINNFSLDEVNANIIYNNNKNNNISIN